MKINAKTEVSLFAVFSALPVLAAVAFWLSSLDARTIGNESRIQRIEKAFEMLLEIRERLARIEESIKQRGR